MDRDILADSILYSPSEVLVKFDLKCLCYWWYIILHLSEQGGVPDVKEACSFVVSLVLTYLDFAVPMSGDAFPANNDP